MAGEHPTLRSAVARTLRDQGIEVLHDSEAFCRHVLGFVDQSLPEARLAAREIDDELLKPLLIALREPDADAIRTARARIMGILVRKRGNEERVSARVANSLAGGLAVYLGISIAPSSAKKSSGAQVASARDTSQAAARAQTKKEGRRATSAGAQHVAKHAGLADGRRRRPTRHATHETSTTAPKRSKAPMVAALVALVVVLGAGGWFLYNHLTRIEFTVNGTQTAARRGDTVQKLLDDGIVEPTPGDLLAIDGSLLEKGAGDVCSVTINGAKAGVDTELEPDAVVEIGDGEDTTEKADVTEETIPFETGGDSTDFSSYWDASIHLLSDGRDGVRTKRVGTISGLVEEEVTTEPIDAGYHLISADVGDDKAIALTFDDGPWPDSTDEILDILEENGAKATFFTIGNQIGEYADAVRRAHEMGCEVCTHTWDHADGSGQGVNLTYMTSQEQIDEVQKGYEAIKDALGEEPPHIMRAPGGNFYGDLIETLWPYVDAEIGWDVDTEDWSRPGTDAIASAILSVEPGQVILMHDGGGDRSQTVEALREALPQLASEGYKFVTISELLEYV